VTIVSRGAPGGFGFGMPNPASLFDNIINDIIGGGSGPSGSDDSVFDSMQQMMDMMMQQRMSMFDTLFNDGPAMQ